MSKPNVWLMFTFLFSCTLLIVVLELLPTQSVLADLPPRFTPTPTPTRRSATGGSIELRVQSDQAGPWTAVETVVQWQDGLGDWHDVDGWRGTLDQFYTDGGRKTWWVSERDFGTGPFRWVVYEGDDTLAVSESFYLPASAGEVVRTVLR